MFVFSTTDNKKDRLASTFNTPSISRASMSEQILDHNNSQCSNISSTLKRVSFHREVSIRVIENESVVSFSPDVSVQLIPLATNLQDIWYTKEETDRFSNEAGTEKMNDSQVAESICKTVPAVISKTLPKPLSYLKSIATTSFICILPMLPSMKANTTISQIRSSTNSKAKITSNVVQHDTSCLPPIF